MWTKGKAESANHEVAQLADRRNFLKASAVAGLAGIVGFAPTSVRAGTVAASPAVQDPAVPSGIHPLAQLDSRFPVTYESSVPAALALLTKYFRAISSRDPQALSPLMQFPFATYEGTDPVVVESPDALLEHPPLSMNLSGKGESLIAKGSYDMLDSIELHTYNPVNVGLSLAYSRFGPDGKRILKCEGIYGVTNNDGKWGIECLSTIFTPADQVGVVYQDAIDATLRLQQNWMLGYSLRDQSVLNSTHQLGPSASLAPPEPRSNAGNARNGKPMDGPFLRRLCSLHPGRYGHFRESRSSDRHLQE
ncbi:MAG: twin-arginine translocation signal domain-containing protein [Candidatus Acidiferrum sp.]